MNRTYPHDTQAVDVRNSRVANGDRLIQTQASRGASPLTSEPPAATGEVVLQHTVTLDING